MHAQLDAIGLVVDDMARSIAFYHELGFDFGDGAEHEPHVEAATPGGLRLLWDTVETSSPSTRSGGRPVADPGWPSPSSSTAQPTSMTPMRGYARLVGLGYAGHKEPWDAFWGQRYAIV